MTPLDIFLNQHDRLRSGWRLAIFAALYFMFASAIITAVYAAAWFARGRAGGNLPAAFAYLFQFIILFVPALLIGWVCGRLFDGVPLRAQGWTPHRGWARDFLNGSLFGAAALALAALVATAGGGFRFAVGAALTSSAFVKTFFGAAAVYVVLAAGEEALFRGYPLQTMLRALPFGAAVVPTALMFAYIHLNNPNVPYGYLRTIMYTNTALAGVWLAVGYWRTRSMWLPLGLHWAWNWTMGSLLGLPVSGITSLTRAPLLRATATGPAWLTGGDYGIEGGLACTVALGLATVFLWRTRLLQPAAELRRFTDGEQPKHNSGGSAPHAETRPPLPEV